MFNMFNRFTERARKVILLAKEEALRLNHDCVGSEHLLLGLIKEGTGVAAMVLHNLGVDLEKVRLEVEKLIPPGGKTLQRGDIPFTARAKKILDLAIDEARNLGHNFIGTEHLLLGIIREGTGAAANVLIGLGVDLERVHNEVLSLISEGAPSKPITGARKTGSRTPTLDQFGRDLTALAREHKLDPIIGRTDEIERVIQVLSRRKKNNPVLIGDPGVGKTAVVEGLAQKIVEGNVPEMLLHKRVVALELSSIVAGTKYRGQFEERMEAIINELRHADDVMIFIDEIHNLVGTGAAEGALDASNILKPALARGEIQCIGATTLNEYRKYIEKDGALERRFQPIMINESTVEETIQILKGLRDKYESHHQVKILDSAIEAAARLSHRYITDRFLPDKAIDLIDEACARKRLTTTTPKDLRELEDRINKLAREKEEAVRLQNFERAAKLRDQHNELKERLENLKRGWEEKKYATQLEIREEDIAYIVSKWTGIPVVRLEEKETERLLRMEEELHKRIVGQKEAVAAVARAIQRSRAGLKDPKRPIGSFIFAGPTGVGKSELAKALAEFLFGNEDALIQIDMSEYMEKFSVSRLIGAPPGYIGHDEAGQLTEKIRRRPYSVVLLDDIDKAHPEVFDLLLQVLEDGRLTDSTGRVVNFRNTIIIMTTNIGMEKSVISGFGKAHDELSYEGIKKKTTEGLRERFRAEFRNRIDEIVIFYPLTKEEISQIIDLLMKDVRKKLAEKNLEIELSPEAKELLLEKGYNPAFGARPMRRTIQKHIEDALAEEMLKGKFKGCRKVIVNRKNDTFVFNPEGDKTTSYTS
jgi:ATP-dependent Clp protease ATP-binding subunit ClpC